MRSCSRTQLLQALACGVALSVLAYLLWHTGPAAKAIGLSGVGEKLAPAGVADHSTSQVFNDIYAKGTWGAGHGAGNGSGVGSTLAYTKRTRLAVELLVQQLDLVAIIDAPCGAMTWMPHALQRVWRRRPQFRYYGVDIVESVIARNTQWFHDVHNMEFHTLDFSKQPLPQPPAGNTAIFSRDALQHLSFRIVCDALENFVSSKASHLIVGSYRGDINRNISVGEYFSIDLRQDPFMLPEPWDVIEEENVDGKLMMVYRIADLKRKVDFWAMRRRAEKLAAKQAQEVAKAQQSAAGSGKPAGT